MVSIIVPVYKVVQYLPQCIESIINQTYRDLEIILVDDGSPDSCGKICDEYAEKDKRIKVFHKENGGLSDARNYGIMMARGECDILCTCILDGFYPFVSIEKMGIESTGSLAVFLFIQTRIEIPLSLRKHTVDAPMDEYTKAVGCECLACRYVLLCGFILLSD